MPAAYVKPYVKRNKNDAADAEAICEAVTRPSMRFVAWSRRIRAAWRVDDRPPDAELLVGSGSMPGQCDPRSHAGVRVLSWHRVQAACRREDRTPRGNRRCQRAHRRDWSMPGLEGLDAVVSSGRRGSRHSSAAIHAWHPATATAWPSHSRHQGPNALIRLSSCRGGSSIAADPSVFRSGRANWRRWIGLVAGPDRLGVQRHRPHLQGDALHRTNARRCADGLANRRRHRQVIRPGEGLHFAKNPWLGDLMARKPTKLARRGAGHTRTPYQPGLGAARQTVEPDRQPAVTAA